MLRRSLPLDWYRQQREIIDVVRSEASFSEEKISVKTREGIAIGRENVMLYSCIGDASGGCIADRYELATRGAAGRRRWCPSVIKRHDQKVHGAHPGRTM